MRKTKRLIGIVLLVAMFTAVEVDIRFPSQNVPWGTLDLTAPTGFFTDTKLAAMRDDAAMCAGALRAAGTQFRTVPDTTAGECTLRNRVLLQRGDYAYSGTVTANCGLVAALGVWERNVVTPAAQEHLKSPIQRIEQMGTFSCRTIRGSTRMSNHSTATAIDIAGFRLKDGTMISVQKDWERDTAAGRFLKAVHQGACPVFRGVLGPDYNEAHGDHFHFDMGRFDICR